jgi:L-2,4-diaminobutyrate decarboxylase
MADAEVDALNTRIRRDIVNTGQFYIVKTVLRGRTWLRTALMNPFTQPKDLAQLLEAIEALV